MSSEQKGFVFSLTFIIIFGLLLATIPIGLRGSGENPDLPAAVNPNLIADFSSTATYVRSDFSFYQHTYDLGGHSWICYTDDSSFVLGGKILIGGVLWLGGVDLCIFKSQAGEDRGTTLSLTEIAADASGGTVRYNMIFESNGNDAGGFLAYWNTTAYATPSAAWMVNGLHLLHGVGLSSSATANIGALLVSLLLLQIPDVPLLVNVLLAVPIWAGVIYIIWYIIKEMIPFV